THSSKYILFSKAEPEYTGKQYVNYVYEPASKPRIASKLIWAPHAYEAVGKPMDFLFERYNTLNNASWHLPMLIDEWGQTDQNGTDVYVKYFKTNNMGWVRWFYDLMDPTYNLMDANYKPTDRYLWLMDAMKLN